MPSTQEHDNVGFSNHSREILKEWQESRLGIPVEATCTEELYSMPQILVDRLKAEGNYYPPICGAVDLNHPGVKDRIRATLEWPAFNHRNMMQEFAEHKCGKAVGHPISEAIHQGVELIHANLPKRLDGVSRTFYNLKDVKDSDGKSLLKVPRDACMSWAKKEGPPILLLQGGVGCGKTHLAEASLRLAMEAGDSVRFQPVMDFLHSQRPSKEEFDDGGEVYYWVMNSHFLALDDLGAEKESEFTQTRIGEVIDARYREGDRLLITSNLATKQDFAEKVGDRLASRLFDANTDTVRRVIIGAGDYRS